MRFDLREVEQVRDQEDHGTNGRASAASTGLARGGLEELSQGFEKAFRGSPRFGPTDHSLPGER